MDMQEIRRRIQGMTWGQALAFYIRTREQEHMQAMEIAAERDVLRLRREASAKKAVEVMK